MQLAAEAEAESEASSILPLDCGFDLKRLGMAIDITPPHMAHVRYLDRDGQAAEVQGSRTKIAGTLIEADYQAVVVEGGRAHRGRAGDSLRVRRPFSRPALER